MRGVFYIANPYELSGLLGLYETPEQRQNIIDSYRLQEEEAIKSYSYPASFDKEYIDTDIQKRIKNIDRQIQQFFDREIPVGVYGPFYFPED